ncbi:MAG: HD domain-containing protein [Verrucomicrobiaceae bacterium]|nr:HD domain-containing protein [Verrucomicrobiaceae bacterium]
MEPITIRELKQQAGPVPLMVRFPAQLEKSLERVTKTGNPYYELTFADAEETLVLRVWNNSPMFATCGQMRGGTFFEVSGEFGLGNDGRSIDGKSWTARALNEEETVGVLGGSPELRRKQAVDYAFIESAVAGLADPRLHHLCRAFLERFGTRFRRTGAARDYHHARRGGLVEHVSQMMRSAIQICEAYPMLNRDLLVTGVLFHDVGKLWENVYAVNGFSMPYSEMSELLGHIPLGMEIVNKFWREIHEDEALSAGWKELQPESDRVRLHLLHLIVAHHGELAFGSPVVPKTPEAQALHYIDNLDAKMEMFDRGYQVANELGRNVYDRVRPLPGRLIAPLEAFVPEPTAESEPSDPVETQGEGWITDEPEPTPEPGSDEPF